MAQFPVTLILITIAAFAIIMTAMAVGVIVANRRLRGSCGGPTVFDDAGEPMTCPDCTCEAASVIEPLGDPPARR